MAQSIWVVASWRLAVFMVSRAVASTSAQLVFRETIRETIFLKTRADKGLCRHTCKLTAKATAQHTTQQQQQHKSTV